MYVSLGSLNEADALTAEMKELIISSGPQSSSCVSPFLILYPDNRTISFNQRCLLECSRAAAVRTNAAQQVGMKSGSATPKQTSWRSSGTFITAAPGLTLALF